MKIDTNKRCKKEIQNFQIKVQNFFQKGDNKETLKVGCNFQRFFFSRTTAS